MRTSSTAKHFVHLGPSIPIVPISDFEPLTLTEQQWEDLWSICGPTVEMNLRRKAEMWRIICTAYMEGLNHGSGIARSEPKAQQQRASEDPQPAVRGKNHLQVREAHVAPGSLVPRWSSSRRTYPR